MMNTQSDREVCPICGGPLTRKQVEKLLRGGVYTAVVTVDAEVCQHCGERLYSADVARSFEEICDKLAREDTFGFTPVGQSFRVADPSGSPTL